MGKSTLISRISAAKPKIADYPFTTLEPHLGVVRADDETNYTVADIPGLVEGAAEGKGLGHQFLRHITRARALVVLVELGPGDRRGPGRAAAGAARRARSLPARPAGPAPPGGGIEGRHGGSRRPAADDRRPETFDRDGRRRRRRRRAFRPDLVISSVTGQGIPALVGRLATLVDQARTAEPESDGTIVIHRPLPEGFSVERVGEGEFVVVGKVAERAVALNDVTTDEAADYVQGRLRRLGVDRALAKAGARDGDMVHIGELSFTWYRDQPEFTGEPSSRRRRR